MQKKSMLIALGAVLVVTLASIVLVFAVNPHVSAAVDGVHAVRFDVNGGSAVANQTVEHGGMVVAPDVPARENYNFVCWYSDNENVAYDFTTPVTADLTLTAKWRIVTYTVKFNTNCDVEIYNRTVDSGSTVSAPSVERAGYELQGWYTDEACTQAYDFNTAVTGDITLYAKWN